MAALAWNPVFQSPARIAGEAATNTNIMTRFRSMPSRSRGARFASPRGGVEEGVDGLVDGVKAMIGTALGEVGMNLVENSHAACASAFPLDLLEIVSERWTVIVLARAHEGAKRQDPPRRAPGTPGPGPSLCRAPAVRAAEEWEERQGHDPLVGTNGHMALGLPFWEVLKLKRLAPRLRLDRKTLAAEYLSTPGDSQPKSSRSRPSRSTLS